MKKCPSCRSISSDAETTCGVCGESLAEVLPMQESLEQSIVEDAAQKSLEDKQLVREVARRNTSKLLVGLSVGLIVFGSGIVLVNFNGMIWGFLLLPIGVWITASAILGGLGPGSPYGLGRYGVVFVLRKWIQTRESEKANEID